MGKIVSRAELGEIFGYALTTVDTWVKDGCPLRQEGSKCKAYQFDTAEVHQWLVKKAKVERSGRGNRFGGKEMQNGISYDEAKRRKEVANAKSAELELAEAMGAVMPIDKMLKIVGEEISNARARILAIPSKLHPTAQVCAGSQEKCKRIVTACTTLIDEALSEIKAGGNG